jgi:hypothetical protein
MTDLTASAGDLTMPKFTTALRSCGRMANRVVLDPAAIRSFLKRQHLAGRRSDIWGTQSKEFTAIAAYTH